MLVPNYWKGQHYVSICFMFPPDMAAASTFKLWCSMMFKENFLFNSKLKKTCVLLYMEDKIVFSGEKNLTMCGEIKSLQDIPILIKLHTINP